MQSPKHPIQSAYHFWGTPFWLQNGNEIVSRTKGPSEPKALSEFRRSNPKAADWLAQQQDRFGQFNTAVAIESLHGRALNPEALKQSVQVRARLASLYDNDRLGDRSVLWSHGTAIDSMCGLPEESDAYLTQLEVAATDQDYWSLVRNDPMALSSELLKSNLQLRRDYQDHQEWYATMTEVLISNTGFVADVNASDADATFIRLDDLLQVAHDGRPHLMQLVPHPNETQTEACIYYETFRQFGQVISMAAKEGVPAKEVTEVIILNRDALLSAEEESESTKVGDPTSIAARLIDLYRRRPSVWAAAQRDGYVLSFDMLTPGQSQSVLEKYPDLGAASLIVTQYRDVATQAAAIVDNYGELGVAVLVQYNGSENFRKLLQNANIDHRIAMVAVLKSDVGIESTLSNPAYVDKWIDKNGKPLADEWWVNVPLVGGLAKVAKNYGTGVPSDWSEIGWAAWDVADIGLMIASFGTSKIATEAAKQGAKQAGRTAVNKLVSAGVKRTVKSSAKRSAMARLVEIAKLSNAATVIRWTSRTIISVTRSTIMIGGKLISAGHRVVQLATSIPPGVRKWVARGILGASLFVRGPDRLRLLVASFNNYAKGMIDDAINAIPAAIESAIEKVQLAASDAAKGNFATLGYFVILGISAVIALYSLLNFSPNFSYANAPPRLRSGQRSSESASQVKD